jgi:NADPH2:quinone reductase
MRAIVVRQHGQPEVLQIAEMPDPRPGPGELLVDVAAAGVNFMDIYQRQGNPPYASGLPYVPGAEGAGTVAAAGPEVQGFADGDRVAWTGGRAATRSGWSCRPAAPCRYPTALTCR